MKNTYDFLVQVQNFLLPLSLKVLRHKESDTHSFYSGFSICPPLHTHTRVAPATRPSRARESHPSSLDRKTQLTGFFKNPQNPPRALLVHDVIHIHWSTFLSGIFIIFTNLTARAGYDTRSIFKQSFNRFEFRVFLLLE